MHQPQSASDPYFCMRPATQCRSRCTRGRPRATALSVVRNNLLLMDGAENPIGRDNRIVGPIGGNLPQPFVRSIFVFFLPNSRPFFASSANARIIVRPTVSSNRDFRDENLIATSLRVRQDTSGSMGHRERERGGEREKIEGLSRLELSCFGISLDRRARLFRAVSRTGSCLMIKQPTSVRPLSRLQVVPERATAALETRGNRNIART